jgi:hypothetical protein
MKRIGIMALSVGLVLAFGACSSSSSDSGPTSSTSAPPPTSTAPAATSAAAETGGLSGTWSGQYDGTFQGTFVLDWQQSGSNLSGTIKLSSESGTDDVNGAVNGGTISFGTVGSQAITYSGSVSGDSMSGTYKVQTPNGSVGGSWSATKDS